MEYSIINPALWLLIKHLVIGQHQKAPNFSAFHWSPQDRLVSIGPSDLIAESYLCRLCKPCIAAIAGFLTFFHMCILIHRASIKEGWW